MIVNKDSTGFFAKRYSGGKGFNLYKLTNESIAVPQWVTLGAQIFSLFIESNSLASPISSLVAQFDKSQNNLKEISQKIRELILNAPIPENLIQEIIQGYSSLKSDLISVRSSAIDEDSSDHSFAGQLSSYLYVRDQEKMLESVKKCWASAYSERGLSYRLQNQLDVENIGVAVVLQKMIDSEKSGVVFTADPVKGSGDVCFINSVFGVGEGLVSGALEGDTFVVGKSDSKIIESQIAEKNQKMVQDVDQQSCHLVPLPSELQNQPSLEPSEIEELVNVCLKIEEFYKIPQDIEWAIAEGQLYILQARPITTNVFNNKGLLYLWDNSNIVESYGGLTLPLTFDFARYVYHSVYIQFCEVLMIPHKQIKEMDYFLRNMLGIFYGRVYYNLLNWYKLTSILPGFKHNRGFICFKDSASSIPRVFCCQVETNYYGSEVLLFSPDGGSYGGKIFKTFL